MVGLLPEGRERKPPSPSNTRPARDRFGPGEIRMKIARRAEGRK